MRPSTRKTSGRRPPAGGLLEAEVVTADGTARIVNACTNPDLFWAIKGAGNSFGVITRLTLRTHDLPAFMGAATMTIKAASDEAFHRLLARFVGFYAESLFNPYWGEQAAFLPDNTFGISMVFQGLDEAAATRAWRPFLDWAAASPQDYSFIAWPNILAVPARHFWDPAFLSLLPGDVIHDSRPDAPRANVFYVGNLHETGWFIDNYESAWLPAGLLPPDQQPRLADALFAASRHWRTALHFNKGLAGGTEHAIAAARDTCMNPDVLDAFALAISDHCDAPAYPGVPGHEPDLAGGRARAERVHQAIAELRKVAPGTGCYVSEAGFFDQNWQHKYWGSNYPRLSAIKQKYSRRRFFRPPRRRIGGLERRRFRPLRLTPAAPGFVIARTANAPCRAFRGALFGHLCSAPQRYGGRFQMRIQAPQPERARAITDRAASRARFLFGVVMWLALMCCGLVARSSNAVAQSVLPNTPYRVGMTQVEYVDPASGRPLDYMLIYPAAPDSVATPFKIFKSANLHLYKDVPVAADGLKHPLVMFSHGAGGNGSGYAWFGEYLASHGYFVAMVYHYRANTFDSSALYVRNRLWQRPRDISLDITHLLNDKIWGLHIDPNLIGVAGHSQGGFTALWIDGAMVNPDLYMAFQRRWKNNPVVPAYLRA